MANTTKRPRLLERVGHGHYQAAGIFRAEQVTYSGPHGFAKAYEVTLTLDGVTVYLSNPYGIEGPTAHTIDEADAMVRRYMGVMMRAALSAAHGAPMVAA